MKRGGSGGAVRVKTEVRQLVHWCFMVMEENLYVIVKAGAVLCSLVYCGARARGSTHNCSGVE